MILILAGLLIVVIGIFNFKYGFMLYLLYQIFSYASAEIFYIPGLPAITVGLMMSIAFFVLYLLKWNKYGQRKMRFPYKVPFIFICISLTASCFTSLAGFFSEITRAINMILHDVVIIWITWNVIDTEKDFDFLFKGYTLIFLIGGIWGLIEYILKKNPYVMYKSLLNHNGIELYSPNHSRGYRITALFEHPIGCGMTMGMFIILIFLLIVRYNYKQQYKYLSLIAALFCIPCLFLTKMRSGLFFLGVGMFSFMDFKKKRFLKLVFILIIGIVIAWPLISPNLTILFSIFSKKAQLEVKGSNFLMRLNQLDAVYHIFQMSPITGLGEKFDDFLVNQYTLAAYEYESVWLDQMARHGSLGVLANLVLAYYSVYAVPRKFRSKEIFILGLAYWLTYTMTSIPSFRNSLYYITIFYCVKRSYVYQRLRERELQLSGQYD